MVGLPVIGALLILGLGQIHGAMDWTKKPPETWTIDENTRTDIAIFEMECLDDNGAIMDIALDNADIIRMQTLYAPTGKRYILNLRVKLDFEGEEMNQNRRRLLFTCSDPNQNFSPIKFETNIVVGDNNDNAPTFIREGDTGVLYVTSVKEDTPAGVTLDLNIIVEDKDGAANRDVEAICVPPETSSEVNTCEMFSVTGNKNPGSKFFNFYITTLQNGYAIPSTLSYIMEIKARDKPDSSEEPVLESPSQNVVINVIDLQNLPPAIILDSLSFNISESFAVNRTLPAISAYDQDVGDPNNITFLLEPNEEREGYDGGYFRLTEAVYDDTSADKLWKTQLILNRPVDRDTLISPSKTLRFNIVAMEYPPNENMSLELRNPMNTSKVVEIKIDDVNDVTPTFNADIYNISVSERPNNVIEPDEDRQISNNIKIQLTDTDGDKYNEFAVSITSGNSQGYFSMTPSGGKSATEFILYVKEIVLDYEVPENRFHVLGLHAYDLDTPSMSSRATIYVYVTEMNDNTPVFDQTEYVFQVEELESPGYIIGSVFASDADGDTVTYSFQTAGVTKFAINNETGEITLIENVDYETQNAFSLIVRATDRTADSFSQSSVQINVQDNQDLGPEFRRFHSATINEESLDLIPSIKVVAIDREGLYEIEYSIPEVDPQELISSFYIDPVSGLLNVTQFIDFYDTNNGRIDVTIQARAGTLTATMVIPITVTNLNNYAPEFLPRVPGNIYEIRIGENTELGETVFTMTATDADGAGAFGTVTFEIGEGSKDDFIIGDQSGDIKVNDKLDVDEYGEYRITVYARDDGNPMKQTEATLVVVLWDENNKSPYFLQAVYTFNVNEDEDVGYPIGHVEADDPDTEKLLKYSLDYNSFVVEIDGSPVSDSETELAAKESLEVDEDTGWIKTKSTLSRKLFHQINLRVTVEDVNADSTPSERQTAEATVDIVVLSSSDNRIYFTEPLWTFENILIVKDRPEISSDIRLGNSYQLVGLAASDPLGGTISNFTEIPGYDVGDYFKVESRGVFVQKVLDYEALPANDKSVTVGVRAHSDDGNRTADIIYKFRIFDINDNSPQFDAPLDGYYFGDVSELLLYPSAFGVVSAKDADSGTYGEVTFVLTGDGSEDFELSPEVSQRGQNQASIIVKGNLDYQTRSRYILTLVARDNPGATSANQQRENTTSVIIQLKDENNKIPQFLYDEFHFTVVGTSAIGQEVGIVLATDADSEKNGEVHYYISNATKNGTSLFRITTVLQGRTRFGRITVWSSLEAISDREQVRLEITAYDSGSNPNENTAVAIITISKGVNDMTPKWHDDLRDTVFVPEHTPIGRKIMQVIASPFNSTAGIIYKFIQSGDPDVKDKFLIDEDTGEITVGGELNWEDRNSYTLLIRATDTTNSSLTNQFLLHVVVTDIEDNEPYFTACPDVNYGRPVMASVPEERPAGTYVYTARACDMDGLPFNLIRYEFYIDDDQPAGICNSNVMDDFNLNTTTGVIETSRPLDREVKSTYLLCVEAFQQEAYTSGRRRRDVIEDVQAKTNHDRVLYVLVQVSDWNDNGPTFHDHRITKVILEYPRKEVVSTAEAFDPDLAPNNDIRYSINSIMFHIGGKKYSAPTAFNINSNDGTITFGTNDYNDYVGGYFILEIKAEDYFGQNDLTDIQLQTIFVTNKVNQIRVVFNRPAGPEVEQAANDLIEELKELEDGVYYEIKKISYHVVTVDGDSNFDRTDVCLVVVRNETVLSSVTAATRMASVAEVTRVLSKYGAVDPGPCEPAESKYPQGWESYWWVLVAFAIFIFVVTILLIIVTVALYRQYENYMTTKKTYLVPGRM